MRFGALKQHSEKRVHIGFSAQLVEASVAKQTGIVKTLTTQGMDTVTGKCDEQKCRQKVLYEVFVKKGDDPQCSASAHLTKDIETEPTSKLKKSEQKTSASSQPPEHVWSVTDSATKAKIIPTLQFAAQNEPFSCATDFAVCYQEQYPDSCIVKDVTI